MTYKLNLNVYIQVGTDWVTNTQNTVAVTVGTGSIIKNIFGRLFRYLVNMCNSIIIDPQ